MRACVGRLGVCASLARFGFDGEVCRSLNFLLETADEAAYLAEPSPDLSGEAGEFLRAYGDQGDYQDD